MYTKRTVLVRYSMISVLLIDSVAVLAVILLRSPRKLFIFVINKYIDRVRTSKKESLNFEKNFTAYQYIYPKKHASPIFFLIWVLQRR